MGCCPPWIRPLIGERRAAGFGAGLDAGSCVAIFATEQPVRRIEEQASSFHAWGMRRSPSSLPE
jgi:hypothetical protein